MGKVPAELMKKFVNSQKFTSTTEIMETINQICRRPASFYNLLSDNAIGLFSSSGYEN